MAECDVRAELLRISLVQTEAATKSHRSEPTSSVKKPDRDRSTSGADAPSGQPQLPLNSFDVHELDAVALDGADDLRRVELTDTAATKSPRAPQWWTTSVFSASPQPCQRSTSIHALIRLRCRFG